VMGDHMFDKREQYDQDLEYCKKMITDPLPNVLTAPVPVLKDFAEMTRRYLTIYERQCNDTDERIGEIAKDYPDIDLSLFREQARINRILADECYKALNQVLAELSERESI
jgi:hypothetical protein